MELNIRNWDKVKDEKSHCLPLAYTKFLIFNSLFPISLIVSRSLVFSVSVSDFIILFSLLVCFKLLSFSLCHEFFLSFFCFLSFIITVFRRPCRVFYFHGKGTISSLNRINLCIYIYIYIYIQIYFFSLINLLFDTRQITIIIRKNEK